MRSKIAGLIRTSAVGRALLDQSPRRVRLYDGSVRVVPRKVARLFELWQSGAGTHAESCHAYAAYEGGDFLDVGAFHGWYSWLLAPKARPGDSFVSFEPDLGSFPTLLHNLSVLASFYPGVGFHALPSPVGDGRSVGVSFPLGEAMHPRVTSVDGTCGGPRTLALDAFVRAAGLRPAFVKVDVEGAEHCVLSGMQETLREFRPVVLLELHPLFQPEGIGLADVCALLSRHGYTGTDVDVAEVAIRQIWRPAR